MSSRPATTIEAVAYEPYTSMPDFQQLLAGRGRRDPVADALKAPEIAVAPRLRVASRIGVGFDAVEVPALTGARHSADGRRHGELGVGRRARDLHDVCARQAGAWRRTSSVRDNKWKERWSAMPVDLARRTLLVIGFGRIGTRTAKRCAAGWKCPCWSTTLHVPAETIKAAGLRAGHRPRCRRARADVVTIHCPEEPRDHRHVQRGAPCAHEADRDNHQHRRAAA